MMIREPFSLSASVLKCSAYTSLWSQRVCVVVCVLTYLPEQIKDSNLNVLLM